MESIASIETHDHDGAESAVQGPRHQIRSLRPLVDGTRVLEATTGAQGHPNRRLSAVELSILDKKTQHDARTDVTRGMRIDAKNRRQRRALIQETAVRFF